jgi:hypothetical protein
MLRALLPGRRALPAELHALPVPRYSSESARDPSWRSMVFICASWSCRTLPTDCSKIPRKYFLASWATIKLHYKDCAFDRYFANLCLRYAETPTMSSKRAAVFWRLVQLQVLRHGALQRQPLHDDCGIVTSRGRCPGPPYQVLNIGFSNVSLSISMHDIMFRSGSVRATHH